MQASTHDVTNQSSALAGYNLYAGNLAMRDALRHHLPQGDEGARIAFGAELGTTEMREHARLANLHKPVLHAFDRFGRRVDEVEFHPSYHALMAVALRHGLHGTPWSLGPGAHVERAARFMLFTEIEPSTLCPISMSYAATPALRANTGVFSDWFVKLASTAYDPRFMPVGGKSAATMGMGMTEKQGGSDQPGLRFGELDLRTGVGPVSQLVLQPLDANVVAHTSR